MPNLHLEFSDKDRPVILDEIADETEAIRILQEAEFTATQLIPWGSNYSFAVGLESSGGGQHLAIYKPRDGETPLYDFRGGTLYKREVATYLVSRDLGWNVVPPTIIRSGVHGVGSLQLYVTPAPDEDEDPRTFWGSTALEVERLVLLDIIANNADRKLSHCLRDLKSKVWGIDHGLTFNVEPKLRTVLWQFVDCDLTPELLDDLRQYQGNPANFAALRPLLSSAEIDAFASRIERVVETGRHPRLNPYRNVPYGWW